MSPPKSYLCTSESVSRGHPDKIADQISDRILDAFLARDPDARVACETLVTARRVVVVGEFRTRDDAVFREVEAGAERLVRQMLAGIGYRDAFTGIDPWRCRVEIAFNRQAAEISQGVDRADGELGAGDQGVMFGYACDETPRLMPLPITLAHRVLGWLGAVDEKGTLPWLRPDAKSQVTVRYTNGAPVAVEQVVLSVQHAENVDLDTVRSELRQRVVEPAIPEHLRQGPFEVRINPAGRFTVGGPQADTGLTGRKIIVDTYGGACPHGGGAFSGKDPSKVDRSAAYMARHIARHFVAAGLARRATVQLAYAIGTVEPVSFRVDTHGTGVLPDAVLEQAAREVFPLTPRGIIDALDLRRPIYTPTAAYGHFGRQEPGFTWETTPRIRPLLDRLDLPPMPPQDQRYLSRFLREMESGLGISREMWGWWMNRY
jgi:S-adenosylmethionine synthetase